MTSPPSGDSPLDRALKRRKELQNSIRHSMQEIEKINTFVEMWRSLSAEEGAAPIKGDDTNIKPTIGRTAGWGSAQPVFEQFVLGILRDVGRPMKSGEFVDEFERRGRPIGGANELKTAWNRLWQAKKTGALVQVPGRGYWLPNEPVPTPKPEELHRKSRQTPSGRSHKRTGRKRGRPPLMGPEQLAHAEKALREGKTSKQTAAELGVHPDTIYTYFPGGRAKLDDESDSNTSPSDD